ncbi:site-specific recombinase, phage integrase family protein, partial [mine drainage metagenome]
MASAANPRPVAAGRRSRPDREAPPTAPAFRVDELVDRFQRMLQAQERSPCTVKQYGHIARTFLGYAQKPLEEVTLQDLERFREYLVLERHYSKNSVYTTVRGLTSLFRHFGLSIADQLEPPRRPEPPAPLPDRAGDAPPLRRG